MAKKTHQTNHSISELAARVGCSHSAIRAAVKEGRLTAGVAIDGKRVVVTDIDAAEDAWDDAHPPTPGAMTAARTRREIARADLTELELGIRRGKYIEAAGVEERLVNLFSGCRTKLLGIASRLRQRDPGLTAEQLKRIDDAIREACGDLADAGASLLYAKPDRDPL